VLNLYGVALDVAARDPANWSMLKKRNDRYVKYNATLEETRPGFRRWGSRWLPGEEYQNIQLQREEKLQQVDSAETALERVGENLRAEKERLRIAEERAARGGDPHAAKEVRLCREAMVKVQKEVARAKQVLQAARSKVPAPPWDVPLRGVIPDPLLFPK
jgi:hypothetical protein